ncbi:MAG TPA: O-antigen ligase family protein [Candidatus Acidoferrales bacterium]|nr:O-antigen ligase family protein [Candidatus Acidoferrales bacterium]
MWHKTAAFLLLGYLCLGRSFAYVGIPAWSLFISEVGLVLFVVCGPNLRGETWPWSALKEPALKRFVLLYGLFLGYGILQIAHGIAAGNPAFTAVRDLTFNYYPIYLLLGLYAGMQQPQALPKLLRGFAWFNGIYGISYLLYLNRIEWFVPGVSTDISPVPVFAQPIYSFIALLGIVAYEKKLWRSWHLLAMNAFVMLGMQVRTEWFAFALGVATWFIVTRQGKRLFQTAGIFAAVFALMYITNLSLPGPEGRGGGEISVRQLTERALSPFQADVSDMKAAEGIGAETQESTFVWRTVWWLMIWDTVHSRRSTEIWGFGYGYPLGDLVPYLSGEFIRTPHNEFFYALGYTGWIGVVLFFVFQSELARLLWHVNRSTHDPMGLPFWVTMMAYGMFFPLGETPYGAIPFYLIAGWAMAPILSSEQQPGESKAYVMVDAYFPDASSSAAAFPS